MAVMHPTVGFVLGLSFGFTLTCLAKISNKKSEELALVIWMGIYTVYACLFEMEVLTKKKRSRCDSNAQPLVPETNALSIAPRDLYL